MANEKLGIQNTLAILLSNEYYFLPLSHPVHISSEWCNLQGKIAARRLCCWAEKRSERESGENFSMMIKICAISIILALSLSRLLERAIFSECSWISSKPNESLSGNNFSRFKKNFSKALISRIFSHLLDWWHRNLSKFEHKKALRSRKRRNGINYGSLIDT